jgi:Ca2+-binding EF-hand superfamily protein
MRTTNLVTWVALAATTPLAAQTSPLRLPMPEAQERDQAVKATAGPLRMTAMLWDENQSRAMFAAADADGDERLDLFEAAAALETIESPRNLARFRKLDLDRDGYLDQAEFDAHYRDVVTHGSSFRVTVLRAPAAPQASSPAPVTRPMSPAERIVRLWDTDGNGELQPSELGALLQSYNLGPGLAARARVLDADQSGGLSPAELSMFLQFLPAGLLPVAAPQDGKARLPGGWSAVDQDGDGLLRLPEFAAGLRRIDPVLGARAAQIFQQADANHDGVLDAAELGEVKTTARASAPGNGPETASR